MRVKELATFIITRDNFRLAKENGVILRKPDPIISKYRFCNVCRADDRVTRFILSWGLRWQGHEDQWFALVVARLFNLPSTLDAIAPFVVPFQPDKMRAFLHQRKALKVNNFNAAYIVSTNGISMDKVDYVIDVILAPLWKARKAMRPSLLTPGNAKTKTKAPLFESWDSWHSRLQSFRGMGSFMSAQVVADLKYFPPFYSRDLGIPTKVTGDWWTFASSGPGSRRGLNRMVGRPLEKGWKELEWRETLHLMIDELRPMLPPHIGARLSAQDYQNCLCEFDKYERARLGEGEPKQLYVSHEEKSR